MSPIGADDLLDLTLGATFGIRGHSTLAIGLVTPLTGPKPYNYEAQVQLNFKF